jgi:coenzyme F420 hydrogenase subunit beta
MSMLLKRESSLHPLEQIVKDGHCMGCGMCTVGLNGKKPASPRLEYSARHDQFIPVIENTSNEAVPDFICPGKSMNMRALSDAVHGKQPEDPLLGITEHIRVAYTTSEKQREKSASGGIAPTIIQQLFEDGKIDAAYCLHRGETPYNAGGRIVRNAAELSGTHGSVYHPVNYGAQLDELVQGTERFAFVGLPCQIAGLEQLKQVVPGLRERHILSIGLFCGGINKFGGIAYYLKGFDVDWNDVQQLEYRYGAWPGKIKYTSRKNSENTPLIPRIRGNTRWKILRYVIGFQGYWMLKRCRMCPDQVSDFADIAVGDPHLARLRARGGEGFSIVVSRTERGESIMKAALAKGLLKEEPISRQEAIESQSFTLDNRRHVDSYRRIGKFLGMPYPDITTYAGLDESVNFHHKVFACVDLIKIKLRRSRVMRLFYYPWQIFEYLFITFAPRVVLQRLGKLLRNE